MSALSVTKQEKRVILSQPASQRKQSVIEYVTRGVKLKEEFLIISKKLPKSWQNSHAQHIRNVAFQLADNCQGANVVYPTCEIERDIRLKYLWDAYTACKLLQGELNHIYEKKPVKEIYHTSHGKVLRDDNGTPIVLKVKRCVSDAAIEQLKEKVDQEAAIIKGVIKKERLKKFE